MPNELPKPRDLADAENHLLERLVAEQRLPLTRYAARLLGDVDRARDVVQDTFVRFMARPPEEAGGHAVEWLFTVCRNRAFDLLRKEGRMKPLAFGEAERIEGTELRPGRAMEIAETKGIVLRLIGELPPNQQEVVRLKFQNGFSYKEISRITDLSVTNVGFLIHTAIARLRRDWTAQAGGGKGFRIMKNNRISPDDPRLTAFALGELDAAEAAAVEAAVRGDPVAQAALEDIRTAAAQLTAALGEESVEAAAAQGTREEEQAGSSDEARRRRLWFSGTSAAGLIAACLAVALVHERPGRPAPSGESADQALKGMNVQGLALSAKRMIAPAPSQPSMTDLNLKPPAPSPRSTLAIGGGAVAGTGSIGQSGGTLILVGANTHSGGTTIAPKVLEVSGAGSMDSSTITLGGAISVSSFGSTATMGGKTVSIAINKDGSLVLDGKAVPDGGLVPLLEQLHRADAGASVTIAADESSQFGRLAFVIDACRQAHVDKVSLRTPSQGHMN